MPSRGARPRRACRDSVPATLPVDWSDDDSESESEPGGDDRDSDFDAGSLSGGDGDSDSEFDATADEDEDEEDEESEDEESDDDGEATRVRERLRRDLCDEHKDYEAFTTEETLWALRMISRVDEFSSRVKDFLASRLTPSHDVDAAVRCFWEIYQLVRTDATYESLSRTFGEKGGVPRAFRRVSAVQFLFACRLVTMDTTLVHFDIGTEAREARGREIVDRLPPDVVREHVLPNLNVRLDDECVRAIAEETWREIGGRLRALVDNGECSRVVRRYVGGAVATLVFARRDGFDFDGIGWIPRAPERAEVRGTSTPTYGASRTAHPTDDKRRVRVEVLDRRGDLALVVYAHVPRDGFRVETTLDFARETYEDVARLLESDERRDLTLVWGVGGRVPILAKGAVRPGYGDRLTLRALPRALLASRGVVPLDFETVRANAANDVARAIRGAVGDDPRVGTRDTIELEYGALGWRARATARGTPTADPSRPRVLASREKKIARLVAVAQRRFAKRLEAMTRASAPPTRRFAVTFTRFPVFTAERFRV